VTGKAGSPRPAAEPGPAPRLTPVEAALIAETCSRGEVIWLTVPGQPRPRAAWHVWHDDAICVLSGGTEQDLPALTGRIEVTARGKESLARVVTFAVHAYPLAPGSPEWLGAIAELAAHRLNARDPAGSPNRWAAASAVTVLRPIELLQDGNGTDSTGPESAAPARGAATTLGRQPYHVGGRRARRGRQTR
jgi:hypothetical protein